MLTARVSDAVAFAIWVAICSAAPEFLWQGMRLFWHHLAWHDLVAALLIGTLLAFFVEPLMERVKGLRWRPERSSARPAFLFLPLSILFGAIAVCIHEAVSFSVSGSSDASLTQAIDQLPQWALIPLVVTLAWFCARAGLWVAVAAWAAACAVTVAIGVYYEWGMQDVVTTAVPACALVAAGQILVARGWSPSVVERLAVLTAGTAVAWFGLAWLVECLLWAVGFRHWHVYDMSEFLMDVRWYVGWSLGLVFAPNPVRSQTPESSVASIP